MKQWQAKAAKQSTPKCQELELLTASQSAWTTQLIDLKRLPANKRGYLNSKLLVSYTSSVVYCRSVPTESDLTKVPLVHS